MNYTIQNDHLSATIASLGGELHSLSISDGTQYLWQGNPDTWTDHAPNLFPYVARLTEGKYLYRGKTYELDIHGFLKDTEMHCKKHTNDTLVLYMEDTETTRHQYPFSFLFSIIYEIEADMLKITYQIENRSDEIMYFGLGGHPGFRVPLHQGEHFEDYYLKFEAGCSPKQLIFTDDCFVTGKEKSFELEDGNLLMLQHQMFDNDAIILRDAGTSITLETASSAHFAEVSFPGFPYLGLWHYPRSEAEYICIEPWCSLPSRKGIIEDIEKQEDLLSIAPGGVCRKDWTIRIG